MLITLRRIIMWCSCQWLRASTTQPTSRDLYSILLIAPHWLSQRAASKMAEIFSSNGSHTGSHSPTGSQPFFTAPSDGPASASLEGDARFVFTPPSLSTSAVQLDAELSAFRGALQRTLSHCSEQRDEAGLLVLSRLVHLCYRHAAAAQDFYERHASKVDRSYVWATRALLVVRAVEAHRAALDALHPGWSRVGPDEEGDVWYEAHFFAGSKGRTSWSIPFAL